MGNIINRRRVYGKKLSDDSFVDMGLPSGTLWATRNIDVTQPNGFAASPFQYECSFFSWGNIEGHNPISNSKFDYDWGDINASDPWYKGQVYGETDGNTLTGNIPVGEAFDAARANLGAPWRMPTRAEFKELFNNSKFIDANGDEIASSVKDKRVTVNGVLGLYLESTINGARLFFSCTGYGNGRILKYQPSLGSSWTSSWIADREAHRLLFYSGVVYPEWYGDRHFGLPVRPVI